MKYKFTLFPPWLLKSPEKHISKSILRGYPYLIGLLYKGVYMGYTYPNFCLCAIFWTLSFKGSIVGSYSTGDPQPCIEASIYWLADRICSFQVHVSCSGLGCCY